jgi:hypothetical protein
VFLQTLNWKKTINKVTLEDLLQFLGEADCHIDYENGTIEWQHPLELSAGAKTEDNPTWEEAMTGPNKAILEGHGSRTKPLGN